MTSDEGRVHWCWVAGHNQQGTDLEFYAYACEPPCRVAASESRNDHADGMHMLCKQCSPLLKYLAVSFAGMLDSDCNDCIRAPFRTAAAWWEISALPAGGSWAVDTTCARSYGSWKPHRTCE